MKYYFDLMSWLKSSPVFEEREVQPFLIKICKYNDLNGNIIEEWGNKQFDKAMFRLREYMLRSEDFLFLYDRENTPHTVTFSSLHQFTTFQESLPFNFTDENMMEELLGRGYLNPDNLKFMIRQIYPTEDGIGFTYYIVNPNSINFVNAMRRQMIDEFLEEN